MKSPALFIAGCASISAGLMFIGHGARLDEASIPVAVASEPLRPPLSSRARWACSDFIAGALHVPDSAQWMRRTTWPAVQTENEWVVQATYRAQNRLGVVGQHSTVCRMRYVAATDDWQLIRRR